MFQFTGPDSGQNSQGLGEEAGETDSGIIAENGLSLGLRESVDLCGLRISDAADLSMLASPSSPPAFSFPFSGTAGAALASNSFTFTARATNSHSAPTFSSSASAATPGAQINKAAHMKKKSRVGALSGSRPHVNLGGAACPSTAASPKETVPLPAFSFSAAAASPISPSAFSFSFGGAPGDVGGAPLPPVSAFNFSAPAAIPSSTFPTLFAPVTLRPHVVALDPVKG